MKRFEAWGLYRSDIAGYMHRWILRTPWFTVRIHHILSSDHDRDFHDHPFSFMSLILRGGYGEHRPTGAFQIYKAGSVVYRRAEDFHRLTLIDDSAWTLVVTGPYRRPWGFLVDTTWIGERDYFRLRRRMAEGRPN